MGEVFLGDGLEEGLGEGLGDGLGEGEKTVKTWLILTIPKSQYFVRRSALFWLSHCTCPEVAKSFKKLTNIKISMVSRGPKR